MRGCALRIACALCLSSLSNCPAKTSPGALPLCTNGVIASSMLARTVLFIFFLVCYSWRQPARIRPIDPNQPIMPVKPIKRINHIHQSHQSHQSFERMVRRSHLFDQSTWCNVGDEELSCFDCVFLI